MANKKKVTVSINDANGLNCTVVSENALEVCKSLLHSIRKNYVVIDLTHCGRPKEERIDGEDYMIIVE